MTGLDEDTTKGEGPGEGRRGDGGEEGVERRRGGGGGGGRSGERERGVMEDSAMIERSDDKRKEGWVGVDLPAFTAGRGREGRREAGGD